MPRIEWATPWEAICLNCHKDCPQPTRWQHFVDEPNFCAACGCDDFEAENPE